MHLHYSSSSERVLLLKNHEDHRHTETSRERGIRSELKQKIIEMFDLQVTAPLNIIYNLRKQGYKNLPKQKQITNFLAKHRKKVKGESQMN